MTRSTEIFSDTTETLPAIDGSYGYPPQAYRLPAATHVGAVHLAVSDLTRSIAYYTTVLGFRAEPSADDTVALFAADAASPLVVLHEVANARRAKSRAHLGLYHFAILLPDRASLARFVRHLGEIGERAGAGDHLVSEAFYLTDPDGLGIEVYADRPRESWKRQGRELMMATDPVDVAALLQAAGTERWSGMPAGTVMGHVHLHVGDIDRAAAFYSDAIGFDRMVMRYPGALFLAAGGYHHHLGVNTWAGASAAIPTANDARLLEWTLVVPTTDDVEAAVQNIEANGFNVARDSDGSVRISDPWHIPLRLRAGSA